MKAMCLSTKTGFESSAGQRRSGQKGVELTSNPIDWRSGINLGLAAEPFVTEVAEPVIYH
jgi:hypothetical protein